MAWISFAGRDLRLDGVQEANEFLMAVTLHVASNDRAVEDVQRREQRRCAVAFVVMGHRSGAALLHRQARLGAVESLDLAFLIDRNHYGMGRRIDIKANNIAAACR